MPAVKRVAIYARVSTDGKGQDPENQLRQLRTWCERMGHQVVAEYVEHESGGKGVEQRKEYARLFADAARRQFDMVLVWALDRFTRNGMAATVIVLQRLASYGVVFHSYTEEHLSTDNEIVRNVLLAVLASLAKLERDKISQRTKAGLERARAMGKRLGRPQLAKRIRDRLMVELDGGKSWHAVSLATGVPYATVKKYARALGYQPLKRTAHDPTG
jgi:DNA invertase Pin-like site-specific DNA recombinase